MSEHLAHDVRQGVHAQKVMQSYQSWLGEGPELSVLRMLGLFDRPAEEKAFEALLKSPAIPDLTESLTDLSPTEWRTILAKLRRARLLAGEDPHNPGHLDTHPLVREYFGEQLRSQQTEAWKECNKRLFNYYRTLAPQLPDNFREIEPLFLAVICGCNAGLFREALNEVYMPRIQRGDAHFAANVLGAIGPLLSVLVHFFEDGRWGSLAETAVEEQILPAKDQLFILMQAGLYLTATRGMAAPEARICYERAEPLCHSMNHPQLLYVALMGQYRYTLMADKLSAAMQIAERAYSLAQEQNETNSLAVALHFAAFLARYERNPAEVERLASDLIELSTVQNFAFWLACGEISRGWARSASGDPDQGIASIDDGIREYRATGSILIMPSWLALKAEALHLANRTSEALAAIAEAEAVAQRTEERESLAELHRLRGVFLANMGGDEVQIETSFCEAIRIAKKQKSVSLTTRAGASYAEYCRQKASGLGGHGFRLPLC